MTTKYFLRLKFFFLLILITPALNASDCSYNYHVEFQGIEDQDTLELLRAASQLVALEDSPPMTLTALRRRAEDDVARLLKALQSLAYYHAKIDLCVDDKQKPLHIALIIDTGPIYPFASLKIIPSVESENCQFPYYAIDTQDLGICIGAPAYPKIIIEAEDIILKQLEINGYPLAKLINREVIADESSKSISVVFYIESGPLVTFGNTEIIGNDLVRCPFFYKKIFWKEGWQYDPKLVARTLNALEFSGLFSSINITHAETTLEDGSLPMQIVVEEAKQRSIAFGLGYTTDLGPGLNAEWEHRNVRGMGEKLSFVANIWQIKQEGYVRYIKPDFCIPRQDLIWELEVEQEDTKGFREVSASISGIIERQLSDRLRISYGGMFTRLRNTHSDNNRNFNLFKIPTQLLWNNTNSLLDPTNGTTVHLKVTPALQTLAPDFAYTTNMITFTAYKPLDEDNRFVLAAKAAFGSIWGASEHSIPPSERFYAGSDSLLRGYHYMTVSPLNHHHKPIGGRSLMIYSLEARARVMGNFGLVAFYDVGNVYRESLPQFSHKQLQSAGVGLRYHTPVGPIRLDIAFPFNPRRHLDKSFQVYFSIGQAF